MTNNDQHESSPKSVLSVIGVSVEQLFLFLVKFLYILIPIQKQRNILNILNFQY